MTIEQRSPRPEPEKNFDPESPDVTDPQVDPLHPAKTPSGNRNVNEDKRVKDDGYPPYDAER